MMRSRSAFFRLQQHKPQADFDRLIDPLQGIAFHLTEAFDQPYPVNRADLVE
jgi:hypothetical protein